MASRDAGALGEPESQELPTAEPPTLEPVPYVTAASTNDANPDLTHRIMHDNPPTWDGKDPELQLRPFLKLLIGWLAPTRVMKAQ